MKCACCGTSAKKLFKKEGRAIPELCIIPILYKNTNVLCDDCYLDNKREIAEGVPEATWVPVLPHTPCVVGTSGFILLNWGEMDSLTGPYWMKDIGYIPVGYKCKTNVTLRGNPLTILCETSDLGDRIMYRIRGTEIETMKQLFLVMGVESTVRKELHAHLPDSKLENLFGFTLKFVRDGFAKILGGKRMLYSNSVLETKRKREKMLSTVSERTPTTEGAFISKKRRRTVVQDFFLLADVLTGIV
jgi:hypothetical protein